MKIHCALVILWLLRESHGSDTPKYYFNTTNNDNYKLPSLLDDERTNTSQSSSVKRTRREPPFSIIKHKTILIKETPKLGSQLKSQRTAYGPPNYKSGQPINFYKPTIQTYGSSGFSLNPSFGFEKGKQINFGSSYKPSSLYEKPIKFNLQDNSFKEKPEYVIIESGGHNIKSDFVYITDKNNRGKLGYVLPGGSTGKGSKEYVFYESSEKPQTNSGSYHINSKGHQVYGPVISIIPETFTPKPHKAYGIPKSHTQTFSLKTPYNDDDGKSKDKNVHLIYAPEYEINPIAPASELQLPKGFPESFKSGFIGPSYLPPPDFHSSPEKSIYKNNSASEKHNEQSIYFIPKEVFDNSKLPLEDTKKHPNFDYQKTSYEVPIYEAVPFDSATSSQEVFPPNLSDVFNEENFSTIAKGSTKLEVTLPRKFIKHGIQEETVEKVSNKPSILNSYSSQFSTLVSNLHSLSASLGGISEAPAALVDELTATTTRKPRKKRRRTRVPNIKRHAIDISTLKKVLMESEINTETTTAVTHYEEVYPEDDIKTTPTAYDTEPNLMSQTNRPSDSYELPSWESVKINKDLKSVETGTPKQFQVISIEQSRSHSYYDGTMAPETVKQLGINARKDNTKLKQNITRKKVEKEHSRSSDVGNWLKNHRFP